ncbi:carbamoyltransferase HypF [Candidatus Clostridium stratigraminis]|uniref:Carbamoyltransferase n=1 Tax=Candidatus Clostridium stratigraminis TaxID=3381661 RepID=A0ABW8T838_9CLOT
MTKRRIFITVSGIVQGVGFRPFVYNLALSLSLNGWVNNNSEGVYIDLEGTDKDINEFLYKLENTPPPLSRIEKIVTEYMELKNYEGFIIKESSTEDDKITLISPDIAMCEDCKNDILDMNNRRYGYPFTNCTNCGPRFSIIKSIPYDRDKTTMKKFPMCEPCIAEYKDPLNRRFHAQPNACEDCGPSIYVTDNFGNQINALYVTANYNKESLNIIKWTVQKLKEGKIFAVKGLTGFHLCCDATNRDAVKLLRERKKRPYKPLAVMIKDLAAVKKYCMVSKKEEELLNGIRKPIVLLRQNKDYNLPGSIAPNQKTLGVMLPYTPLHQLIFNEDIEVLVMTSANYFGLPLEYENEKAARHLSSIVDYFLMHNRDVHIPVDDSVTKVFNEDEILIRRARGYAPDPIKYETASKILACGPNMKNTFAISKENFIFLSQHNGDLENLETIMHYKRNVEHFKNIFSFEPEFIAYDMHPNYNSTEYALKYDAPKIPVQHHHAHIASCMVESNITNRVIGVSFDGTGYGTDDKIWGGEFLVCDLLSFHRIAHLDYIKIPGGEISIKEPWRMAVSYIQKLYKSGIKILNLSLNEVITRLYGEKALTISKIIEHNINCPETSSMGRLFDAVSSIIGIRDKITYEGQASIELEASIKDTKSESYHYSIVKEENNYIINPYKLIEEILIDRFSGTEKHILSLKFHNSIINLTAEICAIIRDDTSLNEVVLSGGVFQNSFILKNLYEKLKSLGFKVYYPKAFPTNDGGIALGQIAIANERIKKEYKGRNN